VHIINKPLNFICNHSLDSGIYPEKMKYSIVKPIYKKGDKTAMANYTPVS
jgi:hypothetical protein